jgi:acyl-CoA synthetase (AMP-forming)/AMP-acid ligase II
MSRFNNSSTLIQKWGLFSEDNKNAIATIFWQEGQEPFRWTYQKLLERSNFYSNYFYEIGIQKNEVCAVILRHHKEFYPIYMGIAGIGALPAVLAYPNPRLHPEKFRQGIVGMAARSGLDYIITDRELDEKIRPLISKGKTTIKDIIFPFEFDEKNVPNHNNKLEEIRNNIKPSDPFLLQHSSGTTGVQKPVLLSNKAVIDHIEYYGKSIALNKNDKVVSWLPLYHDMGLIAAFHLPLAFGIPSVQIDPFEWVLAPHILIEAISKEKGTLTWLPNFAYNVLADKVRDEWIEEYNLESLRMVINCSEPIRHNSHIKFYEKYRKIGLRKNALSSSYAMAETTFAVTQNPPDSEIKEVLVDRDELAKGFVKIITDESKARICVSSGKVIEGCSVKIVDDKRNELPEYRVGEIAIRSVSMFDGYRNYPEKTAEVLIDDWYYSGDYGFMFDGDLFVIGRKKDIIIVAGKNIYPEDIEDMVSQIKGVIPGRTIAFGEENENLGTEVISVIAETEINDDKEKGNLIKRIVRAGMDIDVTITNVYIVPPKWLIKSSAGKPSRSANKQRILEQKLNG